MKESNNSVNQPTTDELLLRAATEAACEAVRRAVPNIPLRRPIPEDIIDRVYASIDYDKVVAILGSEINTIVAAKILHAMVTEITNDVKSVLSHAPTRERLRAVVAKEILAIREGR